MKRLVLIGVAIAIVLSAGISCTSKNENAEKEKAAVTVTPKAENAKKEKVAFNVAKKWLTLVDAGKYSESWQEATENFRSQVKQDQWKKILQLRQARLGDVISRKLITKNYTTALPGAPDGQYVEIIFETSFQNKKSSIEKVIARFDKDDRWRVSGYHLK